MGSDCGTFEKKLDSQYLSLGGQITLIKYIYFFVYSSSVLSLYKMPMAMMENLDRTIRNVLRKVMLRKRSCFLCSKVRLLDPSERVVWALETSRIRTRLCILNEVEFGEEKEPLLIIKSLLLSLLKMSGVGSPRRVR